MTNNQQQVSQEDKLKAMRKKKLEQETEQMFNMLSQMSKLKNTFHIKEFLDRYGILYKNIYNSNNELQTVEDIELINRVAQDFMANIDPYEPIILLDDNKNEIIKLPPIFLPLKELQDSLKSISDRIRLLNNRNLLPPEYDSIIMEVFSGIIRSQLDEDEVEAVEKNNMSFIDILKNKYNEYFELTYEANKKLYEIKKQSKEDIKIDKNDNINNEVLDSIFDSSNDVKTESQESTIIDQLF